MDEETLFKTVFTAQAMGCGATDAEQVSSEANSAWSQLQEFRVSWNILRRNATRLDTHVPDVAIDEAETLDLDRRLRPVVDRCDKEN